MSSVWPAILMLVLAGPYQTIQWIPDYSEGIRLAQENGRPVLVDLWSQWCLPCSRMDKEVYSDPKVVEALQGFVLIRVNADSEKAAAERFNVKLLPTRIFTNPREDVLATAGGYTGVNEFLDVIKSIPKRFEPLKPAAAGTGMAAAVPASPPPVRVVPIPEPIPRSIVGLKSEAIVRAASIVDLSRDELLRQYPREMTDVGPDQNQGELGPLLEKIGNSVAEFLTNLPNTVSRENIRQEVLWPNGMVCSHVEQEVDYLLILRMGENAVDWEEARTDKRGKPARLRRLWGVSFVTSGYALECIMFTAREQRVTSYRYLGRQTSKPYAHLIAFAQKPESGAIPMVFRMDGVTTHFNGQGIVWVDPTSYQILRMRTDLLESQPQTGLTRQTTEISYGECQFASSARSFWLPREVVVTIGYRGTTYRNIHRYSGYRLFSVESYERREPVRKNPVIK